MDWTGLLDQGVVGMGWEWGFVRLTVGREWGILELVYNDVGRAVTCPFAAQV